MKRTEEQEAIVSFAIANLIRAILVDAKAGTGKTTLLAMLCEELLKLNRKIAAFCFNKDAATNLGQKLGPRAMASTYHSYSNRILSRKGKFSVPRGKFAKGWLTSAMDLESRLSFRGSRESQDVSQDRKAVQDLVHFIRVTLTDFKDPANVWEMAGARGLSLGIDQQDNVVTACELLKDHIRILERNGGGLIDFDDMPFLPVYWDMEFDKFDDVFIDEAQDTNAVAKEVYARSIAPNGRPIIVGDPFQAIYAFAGADNDSMDQLRERFDAEVMPLSINWRCPENVILEVQKLVPDIRARPNAPKGIVAEVGKEYFLQNVQLKHMVECRTNAPLVPICVKLIKEGKPAYIKGRDIGAEIIKIVDTCEKTAKKVLGTFENCLTIWAEEEEDRLKARKVSAAYIDAMWDKVDVIRSFGSEGLEPQEIKERIESIFKDFGNGIVLSSIHKQKGGEAGVVWIVDIAKVRMFRPDMTPEDFEQEAHLEYVAKSRAMEAMYYVNLALPDEACISLYPSDEPNIPSDDTDKKKSFLEAIGMIK